MSTKEIVFSPTLMNKLFECLAPIYKVETNRIQYALNDYANKMRKIAQVVKDPYWYKSLLMYTVFPEGVCYDENANALENIRQHIQHIKKLGCNAIHILPIFESPMIDGGFDVSHHYAIRQGLGHKTDLCKIKAECDQQDIQIFIDLVLNHVSDQHQWFRKAQQGNSKYRKYFLYKHKKPYFIRKYYQDSEVWAIYREGNQEVATHIAFPEFVGPIPHWREGKDHYWYYHTYYPQQPDLNWLNPDVFIDMAKVVMHWSGQGFNFRLDSVPFVGKPAYKVEDENINTHLIIKALKSLAREVNSECIFLVESFETQKTVINYFGTNEKPEAELAYNFHLNTNIWLSLIKQDSFYIWRTLEKQNHLPQHAAWLNFLRNHDELSLAHLEEELVDDIRNAILKFGKPFREKYGISGRAFSLLGCCTKKYLMAYFLVASMPGGMMLTYGDDIAAKNTSLKGLPKKDVIETRHINRGKFLTRDFHTAKNKQIFKRIKKIIAYKSRLRNYFSTWPEKINAPKKVYAACHDIRDNKLVIYINLSSQSKTVDVCLIDARILTQINQIKITKNKKTITLGPYAGVWLLG